MKKTKSETPQTPNLTTPQKQPEEKEHLLDELAKTGSFPGGAITDMVPPPATPGRALLEFAFYTISGISVVAACRTLVHHLL
jgi:hypothetical protein